MSNIRLEPELRKNELKQLKLWLFEGGVSKMFVSGPPGSGRSGLLRSLKESYPGSVVHLVCTETLEKEPLSTLEPLYSGSESTAEVTSALRASMSALKVLATSSGVEVRPLVVVVDAEYLDESSAFVMGQLAESQVANLLLFSSDPLDEREEFAALGSKDTMKTLVLEPLKRSEIMQLCQERLGSHIDHGVAFAVQRQSAGNMFLAKLYLHHALGQGQLRKRGETWHLNKFKLRSDAGLDRAIRSFHGRQNPAAQTALEYLALAGQLPVQQFLDLQSLQEHELEGADLFAVEAGKVRIASPLYTEVLARTIVIRRRQKILADIAGTLTQKTEDVNAHLVLTSLEQGLAIDGETIVEATRTAIEAAQYTLARKIFRLQGPEAENPATVLNHLRALIGDYQLQPAVSLLHRALEREWLKPDATEVRQVISAIHWASIRYGLPMWSSVAKSELFHEFYEPVLREYLQKSLDVVPGTQGGWTDLHWTRYLQDVSESWRKGELNPTKSPASHDCMETFVPIDAYRLAELVLRMRATIFSGDFQQAESLLESFQCVSDEASLRAQGTLNYLRGYLLAQLGKYTLAFENLQLATTSLSLQDPERLLSSATSLLQIIANILGVKHPIDAEMQASITDDGDHSSTVRISQVTVAKMLAEVIGAQTADMDSIAELTTQIDSLESFPMKWESGLLLWRSDISGTTTFWFDRLVKNGTPSAPGSRIGRIAQLSKAVVNAEHEQLMLLAQEFERAGDYPNAVEALARAAGLESSAITHSDRGLAVMRMYGLMEKHKIQVWGYAGMVLQHAGLSDRELEIVRLLRRGMSNMEIAENLTLSRRTVEGHLFRVFGKLGIKRRKELLLNW
ncbi:LuxR C-terminal-related transcriptional regulator [Glutamicibacter ardleyensis]|uniref:LuxR C-terminal-related transcriptional regulator n=1 Tax=Glutamicibacter ardleyensis TaxID=225894 RepID=UPI003FD131F0